MGRISADDFDALRRAAAEHCEQIAILLLGNPSMIDRREMRWGRHGSRSMLRRDGLWYDHENGTGGDMIALVMQVEGCSFADACEWLQTHVSTSPVDGPWRIRQYQPEDDREDRIARARAIYAAGQPAGSEGRAYFFCRGLAWQPHVERQLRVGETTFLNYGRVQALLMPFRDCANHEITGVHRIGLDTFDVTGHRVKRSVGAVKGAAMMLGPPGEPGPLLAVCEGLETAVGAIMGGYNEGAPVWAMSGASFIAGFSPVAGVKRLIILADNDPAGNAAARDCANLWGNAVVDIVMPAKRGTDFADEWRT